MGATDASLTSVSGLVAFGRFLRAQGIDEQLRSFRRLKRHGGTVYCAFHEV